MKKIFGILILMMLMSNATFAMTFSQPVKIGRIGNFDQCPYRGFEIEGCSHNDGTQYIPAPDYQYKNKVVYVKGTARFGDGEDALYCNYNFGDPSQATKKFGGKNQYVYTVNFFYRDISKITTDKKLTLYYLDYSYKYTHFAVVGRFADGKWVKFFDSESLDNKYFGKNNFPHYNKLKCVGDTLIISYKQGYPSKGKENIGEFRFKWDETSQWFSIEQVVY